MTIVYPEVGATSKHTDDDENSTTNSNYNHTN